MHSNTNIQQSNCVRDNLELDEREMFYWFGLGSVDIQSQLSVLVSALKGSTRHLLDKNIHTINKNTGALFVVSKEFGLEQNAEKS